MSFEINCVLLYQAQRKEKKLRTNRHNPIKTKLDPNICWTNRQAKLYGQESENDKSLSN